MRRVGIIGGMGPEATLDLFKKIIIHTPARKDQDHIPLIIDNYPQIPDRTAFLKGEGKNPLPYLLSCIKRLEKIDVDLLCMPCNTAHYFMEELRKSTDIPFISMIECVLNEIIFDNKRYLKIGLLATDGTFIGRVYHKVFEKNGFFIKDFDTDLQGDIMHSIYLLKSKEKSKAIKLFRSCCEKIANEGYDCLIAGCTEIPILLEKTDIQKYITIYDATDILAKNVVKFCIDDSLHKTL